MRVNGVFVSVAVPLTTLAPPATTRFLNSVSVAITGSNPNPEPVSGTQALTDLVNAASTELFVAVAQFRRSASMAPSFAALMHASAIIVVVSIAAFIAAAALRAQAEVRA